MTAAVRLSVVVCLLASGASAHAAPPRADEDVLAGYRTYFAGDSAGAQQALERVLAARPGDLAARFGLLQILTRRLDDEPALAAEFEKKLDAFLADAERRHDRSETDSEALFYLANGYMLRSRHRFDYDKGMWGAARDAARGKRLIDSYVRRHPEHGDAYLALGLYNYYVDIAPAFVRVLRIFLFLPSGSRSEGLEQVERAHAQGSLFSFHAGLLLTEIYSTFEGRGADAVRLGERLAREYPDNPDVQMQLAEVYSSPAVEDYERAAQRYEAVMKGAAGRGGVSRSARHRARLGLAAMRLQHWRIDDAIAVLSAGIEENPAEPEWAMPGFLLRRGNYRALAGDPHAADDARRVRGEARWKDHHKGADEQIAWIERRRASGEAAVYAALVPGNRQTAARRWDEAAAAYEKVRRQYPNDPQVRYRVALLQFLRGDAAQAAAEFRALAAQRGAHAWIRAQSLLYIARAHDLAGRRTEALDLYDQVVDDYSKENAARSARVGLITPYVRSTNRP